MSFPLCHSPDYVVIADEDYHRIDFLWGAPEPEEKPEVPPEVWQTDPVDGDKAMAAVRAMCG